MNRSKDLNKLFKAYMARKEEESKRPVGYRYSRSQEYYNETFGANTFHGVIYFYEWSDITRTPVRYFSISLFEKFLNESNLELEAWQKDIILNLQHEAYITCKPGSKELIVRSSYEALKISMNNRQEHTQQLSLPFIPQENIDNHMRMHPMYGDYFYS